MRILCLVNTLLETNMAPENGWLEDELPFGARPIFRGELLVLGRVRHGNDHIIQCLGIYLHIS